MPWGAGGAGFRASVTPPVGRAQLCGAGHLPARGQIRPQPHSNEAETTLKNPQMCTHVFAPLAQIICSDVSVCFPLRGGVGAALSSRSVMEGSCGQRKILSAPLSQGEKSNQIKSFVSLNSKPRSHTQQSLTPVAHTIAKAITSWENKGRRKGGRKILPCNVRQPDGSRRLYKYSLSLHLNPPTTSPKICARLNFLSGSYFIEISKRAHCFCWVSVWGRD